MSAYFIWDPHVISDDPKTLRFILTRGDADAILEGTREFMEALSKDIGLELKVERWVIDPARTQYYSEYLDEEEWLDTWQIVWNVRLTATQNIGSIPAQKVAWIETNATDASWSTDKHLTDDAVVSCLVIADFRASKDLEKATAAVASNGTLEKMRAKYSVDAPIMENYDVTGGYKQLQINLGKFPGEFFASGADYAKSVMDLCKKAKGSLNFQARKNR
jgi:hypothetical protein